MCTCLCAHASGRATLKDGANLPPHRCHRALHLQGHGRSLLRVPIFPEPTWGLAQRQCQHVEQGQGVNWGSRAHRESNVGEGGMALALSSAQQGGCQPQA